MIRPTLNHFERIDDLRALYPDRFGKRVILYHGVMSWVVYENGSIEIFESDVDLSEKKYTEFTSEASRIWGYYYGRKS